MFRVLSNYSQDCASAVWNLFDLDSPKHVLACEGEMTCAMFSPLSAEIVVAGTSDGGICVWDLREAAALHNVASIFNTSLMHVDRKLSWATSAS